MSRKTCKSSSRKRRRRRRTMARVRMENTKMNKVGFGYSLFKVQSVVVNDAR